MPVCVVGGGGDRVDQRQAGGGGTTDSSSTAGVTESTTVRPSCPHQTRTGEERPVAQGQGGHLAVAGFPLHVREEAHLL